MIKPGQLHLPSLIGLLLFVPTAACGQGRQQSAATQSARSTAGLTLKDFVARRERRMLFGDTDGDGKVSKAEFLASAKSGKGDPARRFGKLDRNADGVLDKQEIGALSARRFSKLDADGDGVLTPAERQAAKAASNRDDPET